MALADQKNAAAPVVEMRGLTKRFRGVQALSGLDLVVRGGEIFGLLGPNGAGKTTTLRVLAGLIFPNSGRTSVFGLDSARHRLEIAARSGMMIDEPGLHPNLSARGNLSLFGRLSGLRGAALGRAVEEALELAALGKAADRPARTYSTGMRRRTGIALALLGSPELVVLDEPTSGLDPESVLRLRRAMEEKNRAGVTFLVSSHNLAEMESVCTTVGFANAGRLIACGPPHSFAAGGPKKYMILADDPAGARAALEGRRVPLLPGEGPWLELEADAGALSEALKAVLDAGLKVSEVKPALSTLEEAFMKLTSGPGPGGAARDGPGQRPGPGFRDA